MSRAGTRLALRMHVIRHPDNREAIVTVLRDADKLQLFEDEALVICNSSEEGRLLSSPVDWLSYLLGNWEAVLKIIQIIILLTIEQTDQPLKGKKCE